MNNNLKINTSRAVLKPLPRPSWLPQSVWPFETRTLDFEGSWIAITDVGQGPVLLFVHTGFWSFIWRDVLKILSKDFRCICFDAPGTGQSGRLPLRDISLEKASRALDALIEALDINDITLIFHDLGGPSGILGAARMPERIAGLCAVNTFVWEPSNVIFRSMLALMGSSAMREFSARTGFLSRVTSRAFGVGRYLDEPSRKAFDGGVGKDGLRTFHTYMHDASASKNIYHDLDNALAGPLRALPLMTIFGKRNDPFRFQERWKKLFHNARQVVVPKGNHFPMCDNPELVASSIRDFYVDDVEPSLKRRGHSV